MKSPHVVSNTVDKTVEQDNSLSRIFKDNLNLINNLNQNADPRGLKVKEQIFGSIKIDPLQPIADFKARPFNWKYFAGELAWYLNKDRDINYINNFSSFWKGITNPGTNEINSNYGSLIFNEQLDWVVDSLVKDKNSRQAIMFFNRPEFQFEGNLAPRLYPYRPPATQVAYHHPLPAIWLRAASYRSAERPNKGTVAAVPGVRPDSPRLPPIVRNTLLTQRPIPEPTARLYC